jgi:hypothetical protein
MKKIGYLLLLVLLFSSCNIVSNIRHGNRTIGGYRKCAANDPIGWHYRNGTGHSLRHPVRRVRR